MLVHVLHFDDPWLVALMAVAFLLRLIFWVYTHRTWEDALITVLHSENFYHGLGLTHFSIDDPKPVHGFTSPISVLAPLLADRFHVGWGLPFLKLLSLLTGPAAVWFGYRIVREHLAPASRAAAVLGAGYLAIEHHQILYGMAGMETQMATTILLAAIYFLLSGRTWASGIASGLCLLARPDFILWTAVAAAATATASFRKRDFRPLARFALLVSVIYGPWLIFTTVYYGSPIPNTVVAKSLGYVGYWETTTSLGELLRRAAETFATLVCTPLEPVFGGNGTGFIPFVKPLIGGHFIPLVGEHWLEELCLLVAAVGFVADAVRRRWRFLPVYAFSALFAAAFTFRAPAVFGWYVVPLCAVIVLLVAKGVADIASLFPDRFRGMFSWLLTASYLAGFAVVLPTTFRAERNIQDLVEDNVRMAVGIYLSHTPPETTIACEPLGYVGYYSRRTVYDFPGLCSRKVVNWLKAHKYPRGMKMMQVFAYVQADYIVLRRGEYEDFLEQPDGAFVKNDYRIEREFAVPLEDRKKMFHAAANDNLDFLVLARVRNSSASSSDQTKAASRRDPAPSQ